MNIQQPPPSPISRFLNWSICRWRRRRPTLIRQFGQARLVKLPNGQHQLLGGTNADRTAAFEWVSLFAHEIVFTHFHRDTEVRQPKGTGRFEQRSPRTRGASLRVRHPSVFA